MILHVYVDLTRFEVGREVGFRLVGTVFVHFLHLFFLVCELYEPPLLLYFEVFHQFLVEEALVLFAVLPFVLFLLLLGDFGPKFPLA